MDRNTTSLADYHWLTAEETAPLLRDLQQQLTATGQVDVRLAASLRKSHSSSRTHLLLEQIELRGRARDKFADPREMFFTRKGLEQCTDEVLSQYKAQRFAAGHPIADLCCGIGGDALALARRGPLTAWDADAVTAHFAAHTLRRLRPGSAAANCNLADRIAVQHAAAWHIDPDRRAEGERTIQLTDYAPGPVLLRELLQANSQGAIKVAPAAELNAGEWPACERQWLGSRGECRQQVLWFGDLARSAGQHVATIVNPSGESISFHGLPDIVLKPAGEVQSFLYEPDATILAAKLAGAFAEKFQLAALTAGGGYLTSEQEIAHPLVARFRVRDVLPFDVKKLKAYCREHQLGQLEIKKRGVELQPHHLRRQIMSSGDSAAVIIITPIGDAVKAIVAER
jgi:hypothetical protein